MPIENDISLDEIADVEFLSVRSYNVCKNNGLTTLSEIIKFYFKDRTFLTLRHCGKKSEKELLRIVTEYVDKLGIVVEEIAIETNQLAQVVKTFDPFKRAALNKRLDYLFSKLSARSVNGLSRFFGRKPDVFDIIEKIQAANFSFYKIAHIGEKSALELTNFTSNLFAFIKDLQVIEAEKLHSQHAYLVVENLFGRIPQNFDQAFIDDRKILLFQLINTCFEDNLIFNQNEKFIFKTNYTNTSNNIIGPKLTNERIRQIKIKLENEFASYFSFLLDFDQEILQHYSIDAISTVILDETFVNKINGLEKVNFKLNFYSKIINLIVEKTHAVLGSDDVYLSKNFLSNSRRLRCSYVISNDLHNSFNFEEFLNHTNELLKNKITESFILHFEGYTHQFLLENGKLTPMLIDLCEEIIYREFELVVTNGFVSIERNTKKLIADYVYEILEEIGEMSKVSYITEALNEKYPDLNVNEQSVRSTVTRQKNVFMCVGRTSTFGLRKWEKEKSNLKGGTIRGIVIDFLSNHDEPKHISEITKHVQTYRSTSWINIFRNLQVDQNNFIFFQSYFIGLKKKHYEVRHTEFRRISGGHFSARTIKSFSGYSLQEVANLFAKKYNYKAVQVLHLLECKVEAGEIILNDNKTISL